MTMTHFESQIGASREPSPDLVTATSARRILVAEDNQGMLALLARALRRQGHDVVTAGTGKDLMHWIYLLQHWSDRVPPFELVVTDLRMPDYSGQDCLEHLRFLGSRIPVILITAFGDEEVHRRALGAGAYAVMNKPLQIDDLCRFVEDALHDS